MLGRFIPPTFFNNVEFDFDKIKELCPTADDLWLKAIGLKMDLEPLKLIRTQRNGSR